MSWSPAFLVVAAFLAGLTIGRAPLGALRRELGWARRDVVTERARADQSEADAEVWRKRANRAATRLGTISLPPDVEKVVVPLRPRWRMHP